VPKGRVVVVQPSNTPSQAKARDDGDVPKGRIVVVQPSNTPSQAKACDVGDVEGTVVVVQVRHTFTGESPAKVAS
jgi:hypothetical protein